jgi:predicted outer membrane repeat protein
MQSQEKFSLLRSVLRVLGLSAEATDDIIARILDFLIRENGTHYLWPRAGAAGSGYLGRGHQHLEDEPMSLSTLMQRSWPRRLLGLSASTGLALAALLLLAASVQAAGRSAPTRAPDTLPAAVVFTVTTELDTPDNLLSDSLCLDAAGKCSLRAAVQQLDHDSGGTILLDPGIYTLTDSAAGDLQLQKNIQIGAHYGFVPYFVAIVGQPGWTHRIFRVQNNAHVKIYDISIAGGHAASSEGGGLDVVSGTADVIGVLFFSNTAQFGGAIYNSGQLTLTSSQVDANASSGDGAGIFNDTGPVPGTNLTVINSELGGNVAGSIGGGLYNLGQANMLTTTIQRNSALQGGGAANFSGARLVIQASTFYSNVASAGAGGGLYNVSAASVVKLVNSTVVSNSASQFGGGIANFTSQLQLFNVTVANNVANTSHPVSGSGGGGLFNSGSAFRLDNTVVGNNHDLLNLAPDCAGSYDSHGYNLVQSVTGCTLTNITTGNITGMSPLLLPLGYYGGHTTQLMGLSLNSPAIDAGNPAGCAFGAPLVTDQRGRPRTTDGNGNGTARCDIGAYELQLSRLFLPIVLR